MTDPEFKSFNIHFDQNSHCRELPSRVDARWMIRGMLMFDDLDLVDDPWEHKGLTPRE